jgi:hypothetical protein
LTFLILLVLGRILAVRVDITVLLAGLPRLIILPGLTTLLALSRLSALTLTVLPTLLLVFALIVCHINFLHLMHNALLLRVAGSIGMRLSDYLVAIIKSRVDENIPRS